MEATTIREFFEKILPAKFKPEKAAGIEVIAQLNISGSEEGGWSITVKDQKFEVKEGTHPSPNLSLTMNSIDFLDMVNGKLSAEKAFFTGKVQFKGNIALALKLREAGFL